MLKLNSYLVHGNNLYVSIFPDSKVAADRLVQSLSAEDKLGVMWMVDYTYLKTV